MIALQPSTNWKSILTTSLDLSAVRTRQELMDVLRCQLKNTIEFHDCCITRLDEAGITSQNFLYYSVHGRKSTESFSELVSRCEVPVAWQVTELLRGKRLPACFSGLADLGIRSIAGIPLRWEGIKMGHLFLLSEEDKAYSGEILIHIRYVGDAISVALRSIILQEQWERERMTLLSLAHGAVTVSGGPAERCGEAETIQPAEMIGSGQAMKKVAELVGQVAAAPTSVLIMGETGTGKELIARALHNNSSRRDKPMIKVNCAALPANLIESELFGHERGSFTGALDRRIGKFELAHNSTLFLDEVGELPLELQSKLLRALQEREFERVGGKQVIRTNVRIVAATNRNLQQEAADGKFRSDLYYRLNVFPIYLPSLRERKEDIPELAMFFLQRFVQRGGKNITGFSSRVMKEMMAYTWPGNVRELEHFIERSVLMTTGTVINRIDLEQKEGEETRSLLPDAWVKSIEEIEREHIIAVLKMTNGKVAGIGGAAELLRIPSTTLASKIRRLKIKKGYSG